MKKSKGLRLAALLSALALIVAACGGDEGGDDGGDGESFTIGVSNTLVGNSWREQMICAIQAEAASSGVVDEVVVQNENTDTTGQINQIESLISQGVDAIIVNPSDVEGLNSVLEEAVNQGIVVVSVDQAIDAEGVYNVTNNQEEYGYLGAVWLFEHLGGEGNVVEMRGIDGAPADTARHEGIMRALGEYPGITISQETFTGWDPSTGAQQALDIINAGNADGIWTSGIDYTVVEQFQNADAEFIPIVGADNNEFVQQLVELEGLAGAAVSNPPSVGGVGTAVAIDVLQGEDVDEDTVLTPVVTDTEDPSALEALYQSGIPAGWSSTMVIEPYTTYEAQDVIDCVGPGDES